MTAAANGRSPYNERMVQLLEPPASDAQLSEPVCMSGEGSPGGEGAVSPELVGRMAGVPQQILHEDEVVLLLTKPSLFFIFYSSFIFVVATTLVAVLVAQLSRVSDSLYLSPRSVAGAAVLVCGGRLVWALLVWTSHIYMLTNLRVVTIKGVINVHMFQAHLRKIQKTELDRPLVQRFFATGTVWFSTAAAAATVDSTWVMISRPIETHERIVAAINKTQSK